MGHSVDYHLVSNNHGLVISLFSLQANTGVYVPMSFAEVQDQQCTRGTRSRRGGKFLLKRTEVPKKAIDHS